MLNIDTFHISKSNKFSNELNILPIQFDILWEKPKENIEYLNNLLNNFTQEVDLIVLPEMFNTGFSMNNSQLAELMNGKTISWMKKIAKEKDCAIVGSLIVIESERYYNRLVFVTEIGEIFYYDKRHLFTLAKEQKYFEKGNNRIIIEYKGWKICPMICYDVRFPVWSRNNVEYDLLLYVANWPTPRVKAWDVLLQARAIENMTYVVGVNRVGEDINGYIFNGSTQIVDPLGKVILSYPLNKGDAKGMQITKSFLKDKRRLFKFLNDTDSFIIENL